MAENDDILYEIERGFWTGGPEHYLANADEACLVCFPGMVKTLGPAELAGTVKEGPRWRDFEITPKATVRPTPQIAVIAYEASARRGSDAPYRVAVSSGYVERGGKWKLAWHQQTPL